MFPALKEKRMAETKDSTFRTEGLKLAKCTLIKRSNIAWVEIMNKGLKDWLNAKALTSGVLLF